MNDSAGVPRVERERPADLGLSSPPSSPLSPLSRDGVAVDTASDGRKQLPPIRPEAVVPEIVVRTDMDIGTGSLAPWESRKLALMPQLDGADEARSLGSSLSAGSEPSELSSLPSSLSSKATTPVGRGDHAAATKNSYTTPTTTPTTSTPTAIATTSTPTAIATTSTPTTAATAAPRRKFDVRPKISVPSDVQPREYAVQCIAAAESSRLNPYALHPEEYRLLRQHISHAQVTTYLNIRNGILRLWVRNPQIAVTRDEAVGCARDARWFDAASVAFDWLVRRGYINFGCVSSPARAGEVEKKKKRKKIVVVGAGMSGLGCARQLEGLLAQYAERFRQRGQEAVPEVVVLEGRDRIGGRIYSHPLRTANSRSTADLGGMIITGFDRGNPLNVLVRGQLGLAFQALRPETTIYDDASGQPVDPQRDQLVEKLFNDCLDRVSEYKFRQAPAKLIEGNRDLMDEGRDSLADAQRTIALAEEAAAAQPHAPPVSQLNTAPHISLVPVSSDRVTGRAVVEPGVPASLSAAHKAQLMGWAVTGEAADLRMPSSAAGSTLGSVMDDMFAQYRDMVALDAQDLRLLNWHVANLEYSNAANYHRLSLQGWDIDAGNEWEGKHTMIVGGYQSVPRGLACCPAPLDVRRKSAVRRICYGDTTTLVECEDGTTVDADYVVSTLPLGVLKHGGVAFEPPLPDWKTDAIARLGYGVLNKVILAYRQPFWDQDRDIFGVLRCPPDHASLDQSDYGRRRGRFFQWFNVTAASGLPALLGLMAGDAGADAEAMSNDELVAEATAVLRSVFGDAAVPDSPVEAVVTRWASDRFARGSYSSSGPDMRADDYDVMARPVANLFFAGEHTTGTHPATVHGAYLSGLRAASEVLDALLGPIDVPTPLVPKKGVSHSSPSLSLKRKTPPGWTDGRRRDPAKARVEAYEAALWDAVLAEYGPRPTRPTRPTISAFLFYSKAVASEARARCEEARRQRQRPGMIGTKKAAKPPTANEVRVEAARMWRTCDAEQRQPYERQADVRRCAYAKAKLDFEAQSINWEQRTRKMRDRYVVEHPPPPGFVVDPDEDMGDAMARGRRRSARVESYAESEGSEGGAGL